MRNRIGPAHNSGLLQRLLGRAFLSFLFLDIMTYAREDTEKIKSTSMAVTPHPQEQHVPSLTGYSGQWRTSDSILLSTYSTYKDCKSMRSV